MSGAPWWLVVVVVVLATGLCVRLWFVHEGRDSIKGERDREVKARQHAERELLALRLAAERARRRGWTPDDGKAWPGRMVWPPSLPYDVMAQVDREEAQARSAELNRAIEGLMRTHLSFMIERLFIPGRRS